MGSNRQRELVPSKRPSSLISRPPHASGRQLPKRSKTDQACVNCRTLRRKCSGDHPCQSCSNNELDCAYVVHANKGGSKITMQSAVEYIAKLEERLQDYESLGPIFNHNYSQKANHANLQRRLLKPSADGQDMGPLLLGCNQFNSATLHPEFYGPSASDAVMDRIETLMMSGRRNSICHPDRETQKFAPDDMPKSSPPLPPKPLVDQYVQRFFTTTHRLYPILEERAFWLRYSQFWAEPGAHQSDNLWLSLLYMILALGHQLAATDLSPVLQQRHNPDNHGGVYFNLAKSTFVDSYFSGGDILAVRCMFLGFVWLYNEQRLHEAYLMLGAAARTGYGIGLHRESTSPNMSNEERDSRTASWWCIFINETQIAALLGRPCAIQLDEVDIPTFPLDIPSIELRYVERMRQFSRLTWETYYETYSLIFKGTSAIEREKVSASNDLAVSTWHTSWQGSRADTSHEIIINMHVCFMRVLLSRPFLAFVSQSPKGDQQVGETDKASAASCIEASIKLVELITTIDFDSDGTIHASLFLATHFLWNGLLSLLLYVSERGNRDGLDCNRDEIEGHIHAGINFFNRYEQCLHMARVRAENATRLLSRANGETHAETESLGLDFFPTLDMYPSSSYFDFMAFSDSSHLGWNNENGATALGK